MSNSAPAALATLLRQPALQAVTGLAQARQLSVLMVGGAVRDALCGIAPQDLDFVVPRNAIALARAVADALDGAFYIMDAERGVARVILGAPLVLDFVTRAGADWEHDLRARDFTINAIGCALASGELIDPLDGMSDLARRLIRAAGPDSVRADPVRAVRGVRFAHRFGFAIEPGTWAQIAAARDWLGNASAERLRDALFDLLELPTAGVAVMDLERAGLLGRLIPELEPMRGVTQSAPHTLDVFQHTLAVTRALDGLLAATRDPLAGHLAAQTPAAQPERRAALLRLAALLHDSGKPGTRRVDPDGRIRFLGHEDSGALLAAARARALKLSADQVARVRTMVALHMRINQFVRDPESFTARSRHRFLLKAGSCAPELALLCLADHAGQTAISEIAAIAPPADPRTLEVTDALIRAYFGGYAADAAPGGLINGTDLLALGAQPGPIFGKVLAAAREAQMTGEIATPEEALALARALLADSG